MLSAAEAAAALIRGEILLLQTDTLPGLHARADEAAAVARLAELKDRSDRRPFLVLAGSLGQALQVAGPLDETAHAWCDACWPGPFSLILPALAGLPAEVTADGNTVAVRVPAAPELCRLLLAVGAPVASTSVNLSGLPASGTFAEARAAFGARVDGCWTGGRETDRSSAEPVVPSALIDLTCRPPRLLREGPQLPPAGLEIAR